MCLAEARRRRSRRPAVALAVVCLALLGVFAGRVRILGAVGAALVAQDPLVSADVIVVTIDAGASGVLEAADLVHAQLAPRVAVFADPPDSVDREFIRRGIPYEDRAAQMRRLLALLGVLSVEQIPRAVDGTEAEGELLPEWCADQHVKAVIVVTTADHSRRIRRVLHRAMEGGATKVMIRPSRYSAFEPKQWWHRRSGVRTAIVESQKLLLDVLRHPIS